MMCTFVRACDARAQALTHCGHVYHIRCISRWHETKASANARSRAPCPTCKREFAVGDFVTVYLDVKSLDGHATTSARKTRRSIGSGGGGVGASEEEAERRCAEASRKLRVEREKLHDALDEVEMLKGEKRELEARLGESVSSRAELLAARKELQTSTLAQQTLTSKIRRMTDDAQAMKIQVGVMRKKLTAFEDRDRYEREVQSGSLSEREMLRRLENADSKMALETLVRNLCAKNKQMAAQQEQYNELMKTMRDKEKQVKTLQARVEAYRVAAVHKPSQPTTTSAFGAAATTSKAIDLLGGRAGSKHSWGVDDPTDFEYVDPTQPVAKKAKKSQSLRPGNDALMRKLAPKSKPPSTAAKTNTINLADEEEEDDVLTDILNDVDARMERKRQRGAGSFLKSSPKASSANGTFIKHGADGRGGRAKVFVTRHGAL